MEEDIKILEEIKDMFIHLKNYGWINDIKKDIDTNKAIQSIKNLISRNKELEEKWDKDTHTLQNALDMANADKINNYIPVSLVEEKIEELDKEYKDILSDYGNIDTDVVINIPNENVRKHCDKLVEKIIVLQELLEKRK